MAHPTGSPVRIVTATSLYDGHDVSIQLIRRLLTRAGAEVIHLGHNRGAEEVVTAAIQEDAQGIAISSYQGGHNEYFRFLVRLISERAEGRIRVIGGGGGTILSEEARAMERDGVAAIFGPEEGRALGLDGMIDRILEICRFSTIPDDPQDLPAPRPEDPRAVARWITAVERDESTARRVPSSGRPAAPVVGITGPGGAGKSTLLDELLLRFRAASPDARLAVLLVDPTQSRTGGALLGDRIRLNANPDGSVFIRSLATRSGGSELSAAVRPAIEVLRRAGYDLIFVETGGTGQGDAGIARLADVAIYVMTPEFGAPTQLEKIDMLDYAGIVAVNKFERRGAADALREVRAQHARLHGAGGAVFGTVSSRFCDPGVDRVAAALLDALRERAGEERMGPLGRTRIVAPPPGPSEEDGVVRAAIPAERRDYLGAVARAVRAYRRRVEAEAETARRIEGIDRTLRLLRATSAPPDAIRTLEESLVRERAEQDPSFAVLLAGWDDLVRRYGEEEMVCAGGDGERRIPVATRSLSGLRIPRVAIPRISDAGDRLRFLALENVPGGFPFTAGVFPFRRRDESPRRQFAGEGSPERTNRRFHFLCDGETAKRLSVAFDSATLYGEDPDERPDIFGRVGESGVSVATIEDMGRLFRGFDLLDPATSVSMTINGPAPILLAMFFGVAIDQAVERFRVERGRGPDPGERAEIEAGVFRSVRGTVQADILKEDQAQNTCIFAIEFALRMIGDVQEALARRGARRYYTLSVSGYHIAEAGANPITQLAFTLANGFTYVEYFLARGLPIDAFSPSLSFFFSNGLEPEYAVLGRVARRIWAVAMRERYGASDRSQRLKYHIQTSGRSLHLQEMAFNDIRTTLQALIAIHDACNSLHTNAYDEAITTPTEESVRRAMAIQLIVEKEFGLSRNENVLQGSALIDELTDLVEEAVLAEFERIDRRGGALAAMESLYQRSRIQQESMDYEVKKHGGEIPIVGVNTFVAPGEAPVQPRGLARGTDEEKRGQIARLRAFHDAHRADAGPALERLKGVARDGGNIFEELLRTVRVASLGQITRALHEVGGRYRRSM
ncbi:MAG: cobalamin-dependent protein [Planctomycetes bacterium]|nr:cobalamin-dependent protein [Planctomycetota bacterium]